MRYFKLAFLTFFTWLSVTICLHGQQEVITELPRWQIHGSVGAAIPDGFMRRFLDDTGPLLYVEGLYRIQNNKPFLLGVSTAMTTFQKNATEYVDQIDGAFITIKEKTATHFFNVGLNFRFQPEINWYLQPYLQGHIGMNQIFTNTKFRDVDAEEILDQINEELSTTIGYGAYAGIHIVPNYWYLRGEIRVGYLRNKAVDYLSLKENLTSEIPIENFEERNSPVSLILVHAGITYLF